MFGSAKVRLASVTGRRLATREFTKCSTRLKNEQCLQKDEFPYKHLKHTDAIHMSKMMESGARLPLRSFFAQHRPLMAFPKPEDIKEDEVNWVSVPTNPLDDIMPPRMGTEPRTFTIMPDQVAFKLGPFNREALIRSQQFKPTNVGADSVRNKIEGDISAAEMQKLLVDRFPIIMQHLEKMASGNGEVNVIPLTVEKTELSPPRNSEDDFSEAEGVEATSVRRKRKLKMNRHKYRKRLKEQRTKRRRLASMK